MRNAHCRTWNTARNRKTWKMKDNHCLTWNMERKLKNLENETHTLEYGE